MTVKISASLDEQAMARLVVVGPFRAPQEIADFLDASPEERLIIIENMRLSGQADTKSSWDQFLTIVQAIVDVAGVASAIAGAVSGVYAVTQL